MKKYYRISEERLKTLLSRELELQQLESDGVDNWMWYGEGRQDFLLDRINGRIPEEKIPEDIEFEDVAELDLKDYEEINTSKLIKKEDILIFIESLKDDPSVPKNYGTLLDIMNYIYKYKL